MRTREKYAIEPSFASRVRWIVLCSMLCTCLSVGGGKGPECDSSTWTRDVTSGGSLKDYPNIPFVLLITSSFRGRLSASYGYQYIEGKSAVSLRGKRISDDEFAPFVSYEIATEGTTKWKTICKIVESEKPTSVKIDAAHPRLALDVDIEPFRPFIGKATWGRVVLENGDTAPLELEDLLPTGDCPDAVGNFKQDVDDSEPRRFGSSFELISVVSFENHLVGNFIFIGEPTGSSTQLAGKETADTHFWPACIFQAGNSDGDWNTLQSSGKQDTTSSLTVYNGSKLRVVRVPLDIYASVEGKFAYAKIIFSGGQYAVIQIADLKPKRGKH